MSEESYVQLNIPNHSFDGKPSFREYISMPFYLEMGWVEWVLNRYKENPMCIVYRKGEYGTDEWEISDSGFVIASTNVYVNIPYTGVGGGFLHYRFFKPTQTYTSFFSLFTKRGRETISHNKNIYKLNHILKNVRWESLNKRNNSLKILEKAMS